MLEISIVFVCRFADRQQERSFQNNTAATAAIAPPFPHESAKHDARPAFVDCGTADKEMQVRSTTFLAIARDAAKEKNSNSDGIGTSGKERER